MSSKARKDGFPVFAYSSIDDPAPIISSLVFRTGSKRQATLSLKSTSNISSHNDVLTFILQLSPVDLEPGQNSWIPANVSLPQERLNRLQRQGNPNIRTLCLTLAQRCSLWYPRSLITSPLPGDHPTLDKLVSLATASNLYLLFDINWLGGNHKRQIFEEFIGHPNLFTACPVEEHYSKEYKHLDLALFDASAHRDSTTDDEDPTPPYPSTTAKRVRQSSTPSPQPSPAKRFVTSAIRPNTIEKDSARTPHSKPEHSSRASTAALSSSPYRCTPRRDLRRVVNEVVEQSMMSGISKFLPSLIEQLVTAPPPSLSQRSVSSELSTTPPPPELTLFGKTLGNYLVERLNAKFDEAYERRLSHAEFKRQVGDDEFFDRLDEERLALNREAQSTFEELRKNCEELEEDMIDRVQNRIEEIYELVEKPSGELESEGEAGPAYGSIELRRKRARLRIKAAGLSRREEEMRIDRAAYREERLDLQRERAELREEKAEFRKEKAELKKIKADLEEKLRAQTASEPLHKGIDLSFPDLPDCCVLP